MQFSIATVAAFAACVLAVQGEGQNMPRGLEHRPSGGFTVSSGDVATGTAPHHHHHTPSGTGHHRHHTPSGTGHHHHHTPVGTGFRTRTRTRHPHSRPTPNTTELPLVSGVPADPWKEQGVTLTTYPNGAVVPVVAPLTQVTVSVPTSVPFPTGSGSGRPGRPFPSGTGRPRHTPSGTGRRRPTGTSTVSSHRPTGTDVRHPGQPKRPMPQA